MKQQNLIELSNKTGDVMLKGLEELENKYPSLLNAARGKGTFCAIDCPTAQIRYYNSTQYLVISVLSVPNYVYASYVYYFISRNRDNIVNKCRQKGLVIGGCGEATIRMRPSLIFEPRHAETMIEVMNDVVGSIDKSN